MPRVMYHIGVFLVTWVLSLLVLQILAPEKKGKAADDLIKGQVLVATLFSLGITLII